MAKRSKPLVIEHLENISRQALENYQKYIRDYVKGKQGVYALYRGDRLKYVGLATNLRSRLHTHLRDRHALTWDKFSVYLTADDEHLRELEALVIRIAAPKENRQKAKFAKSENILPQFRRDVASSQKKELIKILGIPGKEPSEPKKQPKKKPGKSKKSPLKQAVLAPYVTAWMKIRADYKGQRFYAKVRADGTINVKGKIFDSPHAAGREITKTKALNGWHFWKFKNAKGGWVWLREIRKK